MTNQEVFDIVARGMLTTKKRATYKCNDIKSGCYIDKDGHRCGLSYLLPLDVVIPKELNCVAISNVATLSFFRQHCDLEKVEYQLLRDLQFIHDIILTIEWEIALQNCARKWELTMPQINSNITKEQECQV